MGLPQSNYTQIPNVFFDAIMRDMGHAEMMVVLVAMRKTFGWHKRCEAISLTTFQQLTGLSRQGVIDGVAAAINRGILRELEETGERGVKIYELVIDDDQSTELTSQDSRPQPVKTVDQTTASTSQDSRHIKEKGKKKGKNISPDGDSSASSEKVEPKQRKQNVVFNAVALHIFEIKDASNLSNGSSVAALERIARAKCAGKTDEEIAALIASFVSWVKANKKFVPQYKANFETDFMRFLETRKPATSAAKPNVIDPDMAMFAPPNPFDVVTPLKKVSNG